jgi:hypothetical protein
MALELRMSIENRYKIELPMMAISAVANLRELGQRVLVIARGSGEPAAPTGLSDTETALIAIHGGGEVIPDSEIKPTKPNHVRGSNTTWLTSSPAV